MLVYRPRVALVIHRVLSGVNACCRTHERLIVLAAIYSRSQVAYSGVANFISAYSQTMRSMNHNFDPNTTSTNCCWPDRRSHHSPDHQRDPNTAGHTKHVGYCLVVLRNRHTIPIEPNPLAEDSTCHPGSGGVRRRKETRVDPNPQQ